MALLWRRSIVQSSLHGGGRIRYKQYLEVLLYFIRYMHMYCSLPMSTDQSIQLVLQIQVTNITVKPVDPGSSVGTS